MPDYRCTVLRERREKCKVKVMEKPEDLMEMVMTGEVHSPGGDPGRGGEMIYNAREIHYCTLHKFRHFPKH